MVAYPLLTLLVLLTHMANVKGITAFGNDSVEGKIGDIVHITWKVQDTSDMFYVLIIYSNSTNDRDQLFTLMETFSLISTGIAKGQSTKEVIERSSVSFVYKGQQGGKYHAEITFSIKNLKYTDDGSYILANGRTILKSTNLVVYSPPRIHGDSLLANYTVKVGKNISLDLAFHGKPKPQVRWTLHNVTIQHVEVKNIQPFIYNYTVVILATVPCSTKSLRYTATNGYGETMTGSSTILIEFVEPRANLIETTESSYDGIWLILVWKKKVNTGLCKVKYQLEFLEYGTVNHLINTIETCYNMSNRPDALNSTSSVNITTYVLTSSDDTILAKKTTSRKLRRVYPTVISSTTTIATTTSTQEKVKSSPVTLGIQFADQEKLRKLEEKFKSQFFLIIISVVVITVLVVVIIIFMMLLKFGKVKISVPKKQKGKRNNNKNQKRGAKKESFPIKKATSDYMDIQQAARNNTAYQDLISVQSNVKKVADNSSSNYIPLQTAHNVNNNTYQGLVSVQSAVLKKEKNMSPSDYMALQQEKKESTYQDLATTF